MSIQQLPAAERVPVPWRNGGGLTREVAAAADGSWRVSLAEVAADGPFSLFPGLDRVLTVVDGPGLELTVGGMPVPVEPLRPFAFPGDEPTGGRLLGAPVTALNLMTRRPLAGTVELCPGGGELQPAAGGTVLAVALAGYDAVLVEYPAVAPAPAGPFALIGLAPG